MTDVADRRQLGTDRPPARHVRVAVVGAGFGGIGVAIRLRQAGITDLVILEREPSLGGVWRDNRYPGCACDVESHLYQFSFAPNPNWSERFASAAEIWAYLEQTVDRFGIRPSIRFDTTVDEARWDGSSGRWHLSTSSGTVTADLLVSAVGALSAPATPPIPGMDRFRGEVFHSARWNPAFDPTGRRIAVVGTGASAIQIVPSIQPRASRLILFQRTPAWVVPRFNREISPGRRALYRRLPALQRIVRQAVRLYREVLGFGFRHPAVMGFVQWIAARHLRSSVSDPALVARLTPGFTIGCKRILVSDDYYPALTRPNVELVSGALAEVRPDGVVGADGVERRVDSLILCTGFEVADFPFSHRVFGREGRSLAAVWEGSPNAHLGTTVYGFPNLFLLQGPNTGLGHSSVILMQEAQFDHVVGAVRYLGGHGVTTLEPSEAAQAAFVAMVDRRMEKTVWNRGHCRSWYLDRTGRNSTLWPGTPGEFHRRVSRFDPTDYQLNQGSS